MRFAELRNMVFIGALVGAATSAGCAQDAGQEKQGFTTAKLLRAHAAATLPASATEDFAAEVASSPLDIGQWQGFVAGTTPDALFVIHFSGVKNDQAVAGISIAFVEAASAADAGGTLEQRLADVPLLQVRFDNGSNLVATHSFGAGATGRTNPTHHGDPASDALLLRAFNDAEALLRLPVDQTSGGDQAQSCLAGFLSTVSSAARCVDDDANAADCGLVRAEAILTATHCKGSKTLDVLQGHGTLKTQALPTSPSSAGSVFDTAGVFPLREAARRRPLRTGTKAATPSIATGLLSSGGGSNLTGLIGGLLPILLRGATGSKASSSSPLALVGSLLPLLLKGATGSGGSSPLGGIGSLLGGLGGTNSSSVLSPLSGLGGLNGSPSNFVSSDLGSNLFGNNSIGVNPLDGGVFGDGLDNFGDGIGDLGGLSDLGGF
jgi:hypothetical protein